MINNVAIFFMRAGIGVIFLAHGMQKLFGVFGGGGVAGVEQMVKGMGFVPSLFWAWVLALTEGVGGFFLLLGIFPRISAGLIAIVMLVAIVKMHGQKGFFMANGGFEYQFLILMICLALILTGGGKTSLYDKF